MPGTKKPAASLLHNRARDLPLVTVENYNLELRSGGGFLSDRANTSAFWAILEDLR
jgi:hypothetical protein